jgi:hypothetical protein
MAISNDEFVLDKEFVLQILKQNSDIIKQNFDFKNQLVDVIKNGTHNVNMNAHNAHNTNNTNNSHNKTFNLQFFLNETCKDAMNIMDFVDSVKLQLSDLEKVGEVGFVNGISNIIIKNLKDLDVTQRPVHCTDTKREVHYVKDEDKWEKEPKDNQKLRKMVKHIAQKNAKLLYTFKEKHPDCINGESKYSDKYNKLVVEAFSNDFDKETSIIKKLSKEVMVDKNP